MFCLIRINPGPRSVVTQVLQGTQLACSSSETATFRGPNELCGLLNPCHWPQKTRRFVDMSRTCVSIRLDHGAHGLLRVHVDANTCDVDLGPNLSPSGSAEADCVTGRYVYKGA